MEKVIVELHLKQKLQAPPDILAGARLLDSSATFYVYKSEGGFMGELLEKVDCEQYEMAVCITQLEWRYEIRRLNMLDSKQYSWLYSYPEMLAIFQRLSGWNEFLLGK
ncbi:hypothetical protein [Hymenobacter baengnokdamensis]|uniref:hypothetical protein n=1 Tax=Hymenobacter baengnokdamensis TaxID=2615203 RepID=UPI001246AD23|nr:hypothetical protein [Hymenobacter baengnokdamensis]